ncbi:MAG: hypothetical protein FWB77_05370 [Treponema sp.]|nr:hypothetical protein [Treponema sp.]
MISKKAQLVLIFLIIYSMALGIRIYWLTQKNGFHVDEGLSLAITCYNEYISAKNYEVNREYSGKEVREESLASDASIKDAFSDIGKLWKDNRDSPHTNFYYSLFRLSLIGLKTGDMKLIIFRGGFLNLILFTVSFIFFFLLVRLLFPNSLILQFLSVACAFLSTATISNTLFLRPYQLQETMFIIFCYYFIKNINITNFICTNRSVIINKTLNLICLSLVTAFTLLTGYYTVLFIGLFGVYIIYTNCKNKTYKEILFYFFILCLGVLFTLALYPKYFAGFTSYRAAGTARTLFMDAPGNLAVSLTAAASLLVKHFFTIPVLTICGICAVILILFKQKLIIQKQALFIFSASLIYIIVTLIIAPYKVLRYGMPVFPFLILFPVMIIDSVKVKIKNIAIAVILLLVISFTAGAVNQNKIENIFRDKSSEYVFNKDKDTPVYVLMFYFADWNYVGTWKYANLVPYFNDEQKYYFIIDSEELLSSPHKEFYLVMENYPRMAPFSGPKFEILEEFEMSGGEPETEASYFIGRKLRIRE